MSAPLVTTGIDIRHLTLDVHTTDVVGEPVACYTQSRALVSTTTATTTPHTRREDFAA
jgi:hypothetical protein